jgi:hypothetical protein
MSDADMDKAIAELKASGGYLNRELSSLSDYGAQGEYSRTITGH